MPLKAKNIFKKGVLNISHFALPEKSFSVLMGQNGSGKSTFLRALCGLSPELKEAVSLSEKPLKNFSLEEKSKLMAWLPAQTSSSLPYTVEEVCQMGRYPWHKGKPNEEDHKKASIILDSLDLLEKSSQNFQTLSSGEQKLVELSRIFISDAKIFLLDEPTNHLDLKKSKLVFELLKKAVEKEGKTVLAVSHNLELTKKFSHHTFFLKSGELLSEELFKTLSFGEKVAQTFDLPHNFF